MSLTISDTSIVMKYHSYATEMHGPLLSENPFVSKIIYALKKKAM
jgi:CobQ-like glutamine amidotransferase family enzyme